MANTQQDRMKDRMVDLRSIINACPIPLAVLDAQANIVCINTVFTQVFGYRHEDMPTAERWWPLAYPDETYRQHIVQLWQDRVEKSLSNNTSFESFEATIRCANGEQKTVIAWASTLGNAYKEMYLGALYDITPQTNAMNALNSSQQLLHSIIETLPIRVFWKDVDSRYLGCNTRFAQDAGVASSQGIIGKLDTELSWHDQAARYRDDDQQVMQHKNIKLGYEEPQTTPDGQKIWLRTSKVPLENAQQQIIGVLGIYDDITQRKLLENELWLNQFALEHTNVSVARIGADGKPVYANKAACSMLGYTREELSKLAVWNWDANIRAEDWQTIWQAHQQNGASRFETIHIRKDGSRFPVEVTTSFIEHEGKAYSLAMVQDISEHKANEQVIWKQANFDALTDLPNRQMFYDRLSQEIKKSHHAQLPLALLFLDLDHFKEVNDSLGHDMGDILLQKTTQRLLDCVQESDTVARLGGDEFTIILGELTDISIVERVTKDILKSLSVPFELNNQLTYISVSIGITFYPDDATDIDKLIKQADQAMYAAKALGRNAYHYFTPAMQESAQKRLQMMSDLHLAIEQKQFYLVYQPIIDLMTGDIQKAEALVRWQHPTKGLISPADFIPLAEETGLIVALGEWIFLEASAQAAIWTKQHAGFQMSINTSPLQFQHNATLDANWVVHLEQIGLSGRNLVIEITEGLLMGASEPIQRQLLAFRDNGIQVSMDDFGTGYSSLSYLKKFDIDYIKIDQSFVRNMQNDANDLVLCEAIVVMAHKLGIKVVAEGIETVEQRDLLFAMGCDYGQGYLFSRPVSADVFTDLIAFSAC